MIFNLIFEFRRFLRESCSAGIFDFKIEFDFRISQVLARELQGRDRNAAKKKTGNLRSLEHRRVESTGAPVALFLW